MGSRKGICFNTGRTHFKKGFTPWNKGKKMAKTKARIAYDNRQRGVTKVKPKNFSDVMRKVNPPSMRKVSSSGYVYLYKPNYMSGSKKNSHNGFIQEHRYNLEIFLNRKLSSHEKVHHLNGDKSDNRLENLLLCRTGSEHTQVHHKMNDLVYDLIKDGRAYYDGEKFILR